MTDDVLRDPLTKRVLRWGWSAVLGGHALLSWPTAGAPGIRVFFGGARAGDIGGPLVKVKRLREAFPESWWGYSLVYTLSNTPYLPSAAFSLLKFRNVPIVHNQNGVFYPAWFRGDWRARNARMARSYHAADHVFFQSRFCQHAANRFLGPRTGPGEVLYNAVDTGTFTPRGESSEKHAAPFRFLLSGKIDGHLFYRIENTLRGLAIARRRGFNGHLEVSGWIAPASLERAHALAKDLGLADAVTFSGPYTQQNAPEVYRRADAYVMTKHNDPCPNTVLEALACGLPVLYSDSGGVGELVGDCGVALSCEESWEEIKTPAPDAVGEGMLTIANNRAALSRAARRRAVERFDIDPWLERHRQVFTRLIEERS